MILAIMITPSFLIGKPLVAHLTSGRDTLTDSQALLIPLYCDQPPSFGMRVLKNFKAVDMTDPHMEALIAAVVLLAVFTNRHGG